MTKQEFKERVKNKNLDATDLLWPFVKIARAVEIDPKRGLYVYESKEFDRLKKALGLPLKEWEK